MNYKIVANYIKNIEFDIPNPRVFFSLTKNIKNYKINIDIKSEQIKNNLVEIITTLSLKTNIATTEKIRSEVSYSAIVELRSDTTKEELKKIVLINIPTEIYSSLRDTFVSLFVKSGFREIRVEEKIDFEALSRKVNVQ